MSYKISSIDDDGCVVVAFSIDDGKQMLDTDDVTLIPFTHRISRLPIDDAIKLHQSLVDWESAYINGLNISVIPATSTDVQLMIGQDISTDRTDVIENNDGSIMEPSLVM